MEKIVSGAGSIWPAIASAGVAVISAVVWFVRLEGKVKANEKLFKQFQEYCEKRDERMDKQMDDNRELVRKVEGIVNNIEGRMGIDPEN